MNAPNETRHVIDFKPRPWQREAMRKFNRNTMMNIHRGGGKTIISTNRMIKEALLNEDGVYAFVVPKFRTGFRSFWTYMVKYAGGIPGVEFNKNDYSIKFPSGSICWMVSMDGGGEDNRGLHVDGMVIDEAQLLSIETYQKVLLPMLGNRNAWLVIQGTPDGPDNLLHRAYQWGHDPRMPDWTTLQYNIFETGIYSEDYINQLKSQMSEEAFDQEYMCGFRDVNTGTIYKYFRQDRHVTEEAEDFDKLPLLVGMDFNVSPMSAVLATKRDGKLYIHDEIIIDDSNTTEMVAELRHRYPTRKIICYPDSNGKSRATAAAAGETDFVILRRAGITIRAPRSNPKQGDGINTLNTLMAPADGSDPRLYIHPRCRTLIKSILNLRYKPGTSQILKDNIHDHATDALRYLAHGDSPLNAATRATTMEVLL